ncbi:MAG: type IV pilus twitching motility protein PilT [Phycisphaerae bacterium]|nr:type IV pilus twitching motility protein PilT [Phycisphaerae bacterium]
MAKSQPSTPHIDRLLETCIKRGASDLHLHVGRQPTLRLHGRLRSLETKVLEPADTEAMMKAITPERAQQELQEQGGTDFGFEFREVGRFRTAVFQQRGNLSLTLRLIPAKLFSFEEIGLPEVTKSLCRRPRGMFLVTGPTGSGKTTTLATLIDYINREFDKHIITIEDPIEFYHPHKKSLISQREVGVDVPSFAEALRRVLRQDPDVILVGELRDLETVEAALQAAETGHLVFGTLHTTSAHRTVTRIVDMFPTAEQERIRVMLSESLISVLSQVLLPRKDVRGMVAAFEFLYVTNAISNLVRENKTFRIPSSIQTGKKLGMQLMDDHLLQLYREGKISDIDAIDRSHNAAEMHDRIEASGSGLSEEAAQAAGGVRAIAGGVPDQGEQRT